MKKSGKQVFRKILIVLLCVILSVVLLVTLCCVGFVAYRKISFAVEAKKYEVTADYTWVESADDPFQIELSFLDRHYRILPPGYKVISTREESPFGICKKAKSSRLYRFEHVPDGQFLYFYGSEWDWEMQIDGDYYNTVIDIPTPTAENIGRLEIIRFLENPGIDGKVAEVYSDADEIARLLSADEHTLEDQFSDRYYDTLSRAYFKEFDYLCYDLYWFSGDE